MHRIDSLVVGAGAVGLAVARRLASTGREVLLVEQDRQIGTGISSRNSEVVHAGLYYPPGSLKARLCVEGRRLLYDFCAERGVAFRRCGKLIVATDPGQERVLGDIAATAHRNGATELLPMTAAQVGALEPAVRCTAGLFSPSTGILDSHAFMLSLLAAAEADGAVLAADTRVSAVAPVGGGFAVSVNDADAPVLLTRELVNAAGLGAWSVAARVRDLPPSTIPPRHLAKGSYFALNGRSPFRHLVYPVPEPGGLGVHATIDLGGRVRFGPDVEWLASGPETSGTETSGVGAGAFAVAPERGDAFYHAIRRYWPALPAGALVPDYAGIRPKLAGPGEPAADFRIDAAERHSLPGLVNLFGIESPGLTASLAIAAEVEALLD